MRNLPRLGLLSSLLSLGSIAGCSSPPEEATDTSTAGLDAPRFCPSDLIPRKDMARYLMRLKRGRDFVPPAPRGKFTDVPDQNDQRWIEALYDEGITKGCGENRFCPNDTVPREQMAAFIVRLFHGADFSRAKSDRFEDVVDGHEIFEGYIDQLADDGITKGCSATRFCPSDMVPREQMAAFLMRAAHPGTSDQSGSGRFIDVPSSNGFSGRIEQAVSDGIMETCGGGGGWNGSTIGNPTFGKSATFNVYAKSSIEFVSEDEAPPYNANWGADQSFGLLVRGTNVSYQEYPSDDYWGAQVNSQHHRLWAHLAIDAQCYGELLDRPTLSVADSDAGTEVGVLHGSHDLATAIEPEGAGYAVRYVLWGHPDAKLEWSFKAIAPRSNTDIFQYGTVHVTCDWNGDPQASFNTFEGPSFGGSAFPSHHAWVFRGADQGAHEKHYRKQAYSLLPDGPGMKELWFLPPVPPP